MLTNENRTIQHTEEVAAIIRLGRVANALAFASYSPDKELHISAEVRQRQFVFGSFLTAGYLLEAVRLIDNLAAKYSDVPEFEGLMTVALKVRDWSELLGEFYRNPCFTMDPDGDITIAAVGQCYADIDGILASSQRGYSYEYHHAVSKFDLDVLALKLGSRMSREGVNAFVQLELPQMVRDFHAAARTFITVLHSGVGLNRESALPIAP